MKCRTARGTRQPTVVFLLHFLITTKVISGASRESRVWLGMPMHFRGSSCSSGARWGGYNGRPILRGRRSPETERGICERCPEARMLRRNFCVRFIFQWFEFDSVEPFRGSNAPTSHRLTILRIVIEKREITSPGDVNFGIWNRFRACWKKY